ncbi:unnamed protein product [Paramecium sonneborni]|uniref:Uncharacterized protein n=1 Tax=Paramecium sonneborni TaxID=65129 RepID=A0A8S1QRB6_9CILI|nr:unnamed protein product [Paramecium sonneborni]
MQQLFWKKIEIDNKKHGRPPKLEECVNLVYLIDQNRYLYFGGKNPFNIKDLQQEEKQPSPPKSDGISFKIGAPKQTRVSSPFSNQECQDYVYILDPATYQWSIKKCTGKPPTRRTSAQVWYEAPLLYVYGGITYENKTVNDLYILNTEKFVWKRFFYLEGPPGRLHFGFSTQGIKKYLMGGASMPENLLMDDVWQLSFENVAWETQSLELPGITWERLPFDDMPAIKAHTMIQVSDKELLVYGGFNKLKQCQDRCLLLDIETYDISQLELKGQSPGQRAFHELLVVKENLLCLYGGYNVNENQLKNCEPLNDLYLLNLNEGYWSKPVAGGYIPTPRFGYVMSCNQNEIHGEILLLGGRLNDGSVDQCIYVLHELDMEAREAWDEKDEKEKNKYDTYRELKKENKNVTVPTMTLVFDEAEKIILEQKRTIGEKEKDLKQLQTNSMQLEQKAEKLQEQIDVGKLKMDQDLENTRIEITELNQKADQSQTTIDKILQLLAFERKKRKLVYRKTLALEDLYRKTSLYIFEMDKVFVKGQSENLLETSINEDILNVIDQRKQEYKNILISFHKSFEERYKQEMQVRQQIRSNKDILKQFHNINEVYKKTLVKEDREYLDKKI